MQRVKKQYRDGCRSSHLHLSHRWRITINIPLSQSLFSLSLSLSSPFRFFFLPLRNCRWCLSRDLKRHRSSPNADRKVITIVIRIFSPSTSHHHLSHSSTLFYLLPPSQSPQIPAQLRLPAAPPTRCAPYSPAPPSFSSNELPYSPLNMAANQPLEERVEKPEVPELSKDTVRKVNVLDRQFQKVSLQLQGRQIVALRPQIAERERLVESTELKKDFWPRVLQGSQRLEEYLTGADVDIVSYATKVDIEFIELNDNGEGEPRSFRLTIHFAPNPYFTNTQLVKEFYWRKRLVLTAKGKTRFEEGYASTPVAVDWKENRDASRGLMKAVMDLFNAERAAPGKKRTELPEYTALGERLAENAQAAELEVDEDDRQDLDALSPAGVTFFAFFAFRGLDVTAEQSAEAVKADEERYQKMANGEDVDDEDDDEDDEDPDDDLEDVEIFQDGEEVAQIFAEDIWPNALKLYSKRPE
ncbi:nucleosome assembly protein-domain-containing protein [Aspergillus ambiguus]|uniref:histone chaperone napB n=1 Tax=Aspergillus ambiguus TaxID=176160 RepID=UPI003CCE4695